MIPAIRDDCSCGYIQEWQGQVFCAISRFLFRPGVIGVEDNCLITRGERIGMLSEFGKI